MGNSRDIHANLQLSEKQTTTSPSQGAGPGDIQYILSTAVTRDSVSLRSHVRAQTSLLETQKQYMESLTEQISSEDRQIRQLRTNIQNYNVIIFSLLALIAVLAGVNCKYGSLAEMTIAMDGVVRPIGGGRGGQGGNAPTK